MISPEKQRDLDERLARLGVSRNDVVEKFVRSGGHGGQNVNKVSTCVYLKHIPTGIEVKVSRERSQAVNRFLAWRTLAERIEERTLRIRSERKKEIEKVRRQKRKRSKRAREKMLREKRIVAQKKTLRREPPIDM